MNKSENIGQLAKALSNIQGEIEDIKRDKKGYGYNYGDLSQCLQILRPLLKKNNMAVIQSPGAIIQIPESKEYKISLSTTLLHESGEWHEESMEIIVTVGKGMIYAQAEGSAISYARRYALLATFAMGAEDDDLTAIAKSAGTPQKEALSDAYAKKQMMEHLNDLLKKDENPQETTSKICAFYKINALDDLSSHQLVEVMKNLKKRLDVEPQKVISAQPIGENNVTK